MLRTTSNRDLINISQAIGLQPDLEICSIDTIPDLDRDCNVIVNADIEKGNGTHWIALVNNSKRKYMIVFDPFGMPLDHRIISAGKKSGKILVSVDTQTQDIEADSCGWWCIWFLSMIQSGYSLGEILSLCSSETEENEQYLEDYFLG